MKINIVAGQIQVSLPQTPTCRVVWVKNDTKYQSIFPTPASGNDLWQVLSGRGCPSLAAVQSVDGINPPAPLHRPHPASRRIVRYQTLSEQG